MMQRIRTYGYRLITTLCVVWSLNSALLTAQNYLGVAFAGHVPFTIDGLNLTTPQIGYGGELGLVYEWHRNHFVLQTGVQYSLLHPMVSVANQALEQDMIDTRGVRFTYRGSLDNRTDGIFFGQVAVPLYVGGIWNGVYAIAGVKVGYNLHAQAMQTAQLKTAGDYQGRYYDWFEDMPNHGYHDYLPTKYTHPISISKIDVRVGVELGYAFALSSAYGHTLPMMKVGVFAEGGVLDMRNSQLRNSSTPRTQPDYSQYMSVQMTNIYASQEAAGFAAHLLTCGIRLTFLFPVSGSSSSYYPCRCLHD